MGSFLVNFISRGETFPQFYIQYKFDPFTIDVAAEYKKFEFPGMSSIISYFSSSPSFKWKLNLFSQIRATCWIDPNMEFTSLVQVPLSFYNNLSWPIAKEKLKNWQIHFNFCMRQTRHIPKRKQDWVSPLSNAKGSVNYAKN